MKIEGFRVWVRIDREPLVAQLSRLSQRVPEQLFACAVSDRGWVDEHINKFPGRRVTGKLVITNDLSGPFAADDVHTIALGGVYRELEAARSQEFLVISPVALAT